LHKFIRYCSYGSLEYMPDLVTRSLLDGQTQGTVDIVVLHALRKTTVNLPKSSKRNQVSKSEEFVKTPLSSAGVFVHGLTHTSVRLSTAELSE
jgi:hypothetical protein